MTAAKLNTISVACPKCGHRQQEPPTAYSTVCKKCRVHFRLGPSAAPENKLQKEAIEHRLIRCFQCDTELEVSLAAESTMCKRCSSHVDLRDYQITQTVSKNFRTYGRLVLEEKGYILNTDSLVGEAVIKGRFIGKISARRSLEIYSSANIKGSFTTGCLIVPVGNHFRWKDPLQVGGAEISGELAATLNSTGTVVLKSTARFFGDIYAAGLVIESGAVFVGGSKIGGEPPGADTLKKAPEPKVSRTPKP